MYLLSSIQKKILFTGLLLPLASTVLAQDVTKAAEKTVASDNNQLAILLAIMTIILAFVIWGMGQVLVELSRQIVERNKNTSPILSIVLLFGFSLLSQLSFAQDAGTALPAKVVANYGGLSKMAFETFVTVISVEVITILFLAFSIKRIYAELLPEKQMRIVKKTAIGSWWSKLDKKLFTRAIPVEKEADVLLDHNYDGIRELDNALPPWWKYGFYITIAVAFIYLLNFHVLGLGKNPDQEYAAEMEKAKIEKEIYDAQNKDKVDENNVQMADANGIKAGQEMFEANCVVCHMKGGGGSQVPASVGPNLTDDYWLHKGSLNNIFQSITHGYPDKGMQAWSVKFDPKEISFLASYIKSIRGTNPPNAKLPQGELYVETAVVPARDTTKAVKTDSASVIKK